MGEYTWTLVRSGHPTMVGMGFEDDIEHTLSRTELPGMISAQWLIDVLHAAEQGRGYAVYTHDVGGPDEWRFSWIALAELRAGGAF